MISRDRRGQIVESPDPQEALIRRLYGTAPGQALLRVLVRPWLSRMAGHVLDRKVSRHLIPAFVRKNQIDLSDYPDRPYRSFNDFFTRQVSEGKRPIDQDRSHLITPCDGKLTAIPVTDQARFYVKGVSYTLEKLLRDKKLAERYQGGTVLLFRLSVDDYHRYCFPEDGIPGPQVTIPGFFHTVNPIAAESAPIYRENTRTYLTLHTVAWGDMILMEVGALLVGRIDNLPHGPQVQRGQEKGWFSFGGSTILVILERDRAEIDRDILQNSAAGEETLVKLGQRIGTQMGHV